MDDMCEIDRFMSRWEDKALAYYTELNGKYQKLIREQKQEEEKYRKKHGLSEWVCVPSSMRSAHYNSKNMFLKDTVRNISVENIIRSYGFSKRFDAVILKFIKRESERKKKNLLSRIQNKTGDISSASLNIGVDGELNGLIEGEKGRVNINTIYAGGYNIQCLHFRVLIKSNG
jgi:hypothetical protein